MSGYPEIFRTAPKEMKPRITSTVWSRARIVVVRDIRALVAERR